MKGCHGDHGNGSRDHQNKRASEALEMLAPGHCVQVTVDEVGAQSWL